MRVKHEGMGRHTIHVSMDELSLILSCLAAAALSDLKDAEDLLRKMKGPEDLTRSTKKVLGLLDGLKKIKGLGGASVEVRAVGAKEPRKSQTAPKMFQDMLDKVNKGDKDASE